MTQLMRMMWLLCFWGNLLQVIVTVPDSRMYMDLRLVNAVPFAKV